MASDNLVWATNSMKTSVSALKKKLSNLKIQVELFDAELDKVDDKLDKILVQADIYKSKLERELGREVRRLERELTLLRKEPGFIEPTEVTEKELSIACTVAIFDSILRLMSHNADDFKLASEAFLFPSVIERVIAGDEEAYFLTEVPASAGIVVARGREHVAWVREQFDSHITDPDTWEKGLETISNWWRGDALPMLYGCRDEQWDIDVPLTLTEMLTWRDVPAERPITFSAIFDAYEIYRKHKDIAYEKTGLRQFELKQFAF